MGQTKPTLFNAELTTQERDALTNIVMELLDAGHKIIDAKYINNR